jgi:hypothetical protein
MILRFTQNDSFQLVILNAVKDLDLWTMILRFTQNDSFQLGILNEVKDLDLADNDSSFQSE